MPVLLKDTGTFQATSVALRCDCCGIFKAGFQFTKFDQYVVICVTCLHDVIKLRAAMKDRDDG